MRENNIAVVPSGGSGAASRKAPAPEAAPADAAAKTGATHGAADPQPVTAPAPARKSA